MSVERRELKFATLDEAVRDAEQLLNGGYERAGNWDLTQCCHHLCVLMDYPIDGFPEFAFPMNLASWFAKKTIAPRFLNRVLDSESWPAKSATDQRTVLKTGGNDSEAVTRMSASVQRLLEHTGPFQESPLFGMLDKEALIKLHRIHTAHHLSFLVPKNDSGSQRQIV